MTVKNMSHKKGPYEKYIKRPLDVSVSLVAVAVLSPVLLTLAILVRAKLGAPVLFVQERPGLNGELFRLYKFRTMTDERNGQGELLPDEKRQTDFGKRLRATSLDELPELFNVISGKMSLVGPRPLLASYLSRYSEHQARRHELRPGITGYAQVNGRNEISWVKKFELDVEYVDNVSFIADMSIILKTVKTVVRREGIGGDAGMEEFMGNAE